ncbi:GTP binding domain, partial [Trinorchestia longiramus]
RTLERELNIRVVDRYWVVLAIFHQHANTIEARMQVALAELPYIRSLTKQPREQSLIDRRIRWLQAALSKLLRHRSHVRHHRRNVDLPSVAVLGYTNAGKTSLISCLSGDSSVQGKDQLFATLDVTAHGFSLPCGSNCVLLDTVGFIQDLPTELVSSFNATLQDACHADVIIHIRDISHPDRILHHTTVMAALYSIGVPSTTPIITVDNKADLLPKGLRRSSDQSFCSYLPSDNNYKSLCQQRIHPGVDSTFASFQLKQLQIQYDNTPALAVSVKTKEGLIPLVDTLEEKLLEATHKRLYRMKLPTGGPHLRSV